ncbi:hypothetical protein DCAR_0414674 [Daucus carota subsp. sativus]|nr:hypothetical protein DCAR_0414674 [Daucus carota subsp. sativus]
MERKLMLGKDVADSGVRPRLTRNVFNHDLSMMKEDKQPRLPYTIDDLLSEEDGRESKVWKKLVNIRDSCKRLRDDEDMELVTIVAGFIVVVAAVSYGQMYGQMMKISKF